MRDAQLRHMMLSATATAVDFCVMIFFKKGFLIGHEHKFENSY